MDISGESRLPYHRDLVWTSLNDPDVLKLAVPGCESLEQDGDRFFGSVVAGVGPIRARFQGEANLTEIDQPNGYTLTASGAGGLSGFANAVVKIRLEEHEGTTKLRYNADVALGGKLAQLGSRLIESTAQDWIAKFFDRFASVVGNGGELPNKVEPPPKDPRSALAGLGGWFSNRRNRLTDQFKSGPKRNSEHPPTELKPQPISQVEPAHPHVLPSGMIDVDVGHQVALITLQRPQQKNCLTLHMWQELRQIFSELSSNDDVRCVVLRGDGGNFSSGADISEFGDVRDTPEQVEHYEHAVDAVSEAIIACRKPVIAAIEGYCIGGGLGIAMACDFRIATSNSQMFIPAARMSIVYGLRETQTLLALVGLSWAKRILFTAERVSANQAHAIGLVDDVVAEGDFEVQLSNRVEALKAFAPISIAGSKAILNDLAFTTSSDLAARATALVKAAGNSQDYQEGRLAFAEKREPKFLGR